MTIHQTLSQLANQCVLCGLCTPHCPTYRLFQTENESPRGRIALFKALAEKQLDFSDDLSKSLDHCLTCRACERVCPSQVNYSAINNLGRILMAQKPHNKQQPISHLLSQKLTEKLLVTQALHPLLKLTAKTMAPVQVLLGEKVQQSSMGSFTREIAMDTSHSSPLNEAYPIADISNSKTKGQVILFKGCSGDLFEQQNIAASIRLLNACGFNVLIPKKQQCCGAIKLRHGDIEGAMTLAKKNIASFTTLLSKSSAIVSISNSCSGQLKEYARLTELEETVDLTSRTQNAIQVGAEAIARSAEDIIAFLHQELSARMVKFAPLNQEIAVHTSCSLKNVLKEEQLLFELLAYIPGIRLKKLNDQFCCGAAGSYMLQYPEVANRLLHDKITDIEQKNCTIVVSSNIGCTLHFKQGLKKQALKSGQTVEVIHPVRLLARQLIE